MSSSDSDGSIINYTWNFTHNGTPVSLYGANPSYNFFNNETTVVTLNVTDNDWRYDEDNMLVTITFTPPVANAGDDFEAYRGNRSLSGAGSTDSDGTIVNYTWNFTDAGAQILYGINPTYDFQNIGVLIITLNVTDDDGLTDEDTVSVTIVLATPVSVVGEYGHFGRIILGDNITLNGNGSTDADGTIVNYTWEITEGNQSIIILYGITAIYTFNSSGSYDILLNVTDNDGLYNTSSTSVIVSSELGFLLLSLLAIAPIIIIALLIVFIKKRMDEIQRKNQL